MLLTKRYDVTSIRFQSVNTAYYNLSIPKTCHETLNSTYVQVLDHPLWKFLKNQIFIKPWKPFLTTRLFYHLVQLSFKKCFRKRISNLECWFEVRDFYPARAEYPVYIGYKIHNSRSIEDVELYRNKVFSWVFMHFEFMYYDIFDKRGVTSMAS